ncbi:retinol dehydrogenase 14 [Orussus abietinus]|uniref:retinol dehydrogenase 14 n=1 Tax=Orussus abietinus TaxID=222816 RepID=UPI00062507E8|nr:retinol dehydrogenase 14 [Orussus abietinus]XP_023287502.1 retinol dehydrogenase 14 [Orussus abietinus]XP_023287503.1 retinol dehydrogenase 14 [Orussus abietinus]
MTYPCLWSVIIYAACATGLAAVVKTYLVLTCGKVKTDKTLNDHVVIITGANREDIINQSKNENILVHHLDLCSLTSVRKFAREIISTENRLDVLVNNAGAHIKENYKTEDGLQIGMQINHYGPFLLTYLLIDLLKKSAPSRIVHVSSILHRLGRVECDNMNCEKSFNDLKVYFNSKLYNLICSNEMARRLSETRVTSNSLHPGVVKTDLFRNMPFAWKCSMKVLGLFLKTSKEGAQTTIYLSISDEVEGVSGKYFVDCKEVTPSVTARDEKIARELWDKCCDLVGLKVEERNI